MAGVRRVVARVRSTLCVRGSRAPAPAPPPPAGRLAASAGYVRRPRFRGLRTRGGRRSRRRDAQAPRPARLLFPGRPAVQVTARGPGVLCSAAARVKPAAGRPSPTAAARPPLRGWGGGLMDCQLGFDAGGSFCPRPEPPPRTRGSGSGGPAIGGAGWRSAATTSRGQAGRGERASRAPGCERAGAAQGSEQAARAHRCSWRSTWRRRRASSCRRGWRGGRGSGCGARWLGWCEGGRREARGACLAGPGAFGTPSDACQLAPASLDEHRSRPPRGRRCPALPKRGARTTGRRTAAAQCC